MKKYLKLIKIALCLWSLWGLFPLFAQEAAPKEKPSTNSDTIVSLKEKKASRPLSAGENEAGNPLLGIAVVDIAWINENSTEMKSICDQADRLRESYQQEIAALEKSLREERKELDSDKIILTTEEKESRERAFTLKENRLRQLAHRRKNQWEQALETAKEKFFRRFQDIVEQIAKELHVTIVVTKSVVPYHAASCDITQRVLEELNATAQSVTLHSSAADK